MIENSVARTEEDTREDYENGGGIDTRRWVWEKIKAGIDSGIK